MYKRWVSFCLVASMLCGMTAVHAANTQEQQLTQVTALVKQQITIDSSYTKFTGTQSQNELGVCWDLNWEKDGEQVRVSVQDDGTILSYYHSVDQVYGHNERAVPKIREGDEEKQRTAAQTFTNRVMRDKESVVFEAAQSRSIQPLYESNANLYGNLYYDGVRTPVSVQLAVSPNTMQVQSYYRNVQARQGGIPSGRPSIDLSTAEKELHPILALRLVYTKADAADRTAILRYIPQDHDEYYVDAQSGKLVNLTEITQQLWEQDKESARGNLADDAAMPPTSMPTEAEQEGAALLRDALSKEALDGKLRAMSELGLGGFRTSGSRYRVDHESGDISCTIEFVKAEKKNTVYKGATVDAKTGALQSLYTYATEQADAPTAASDTDMKKAEAFLQKYESQSFAKTMLYNADALQGGTASYTYAQEVNGYPFPQNQFTVEINHKTGLVDGFSRIWEDDITFSEPGTPIGAENAQSAYAAIYTTELRYVPVPMQKIDISDPRRSVNANILNEWKLGYQLQQKQPINCMGIDANTGKVIFDKDDNATLTYTDADAATYPQIIALAQYGVGYQGGLFQPQKALTQEDMLALLMSVGGDIYDPKGDKAQESLYAWAYGNALLTRQEYAPTAQISRATLIRYLVTYIGYGKAADMPEIYRCSFTDEKDIPRDCYGYVAIAQGMGIVSGNENGSLQPNRVATRAQAATMLYNYMKR